MYKVIFNNGFWYIKTTVNRKHIMVGPFATKQGAICNCNDANRRILEYK